MHAPDYYKRFLWIPPLSQKNGLFSSLLQMPLFIFFVLRTIVPIFNLARALPYIHILSFGVPTTELGSPKEWGQSGKKENI